jgi:O-antigen/teichoic acid export membrane protein
LLLECISLLILAGFLHFCAAALSAVLTASQRFAFSALAYSVGSAVGLGIAVLLLPFIGPIGSAIGLLSGAAVVAAAHALYVERLGVPLRVWPRDKNQRSGRALLLKVVAGGALLVAQQIELAITLAMLSPTRGAITSFTYAFLLLSLILSLSFTPLTLALMPRLIESISETGPHAAGAQLIRIVTSAAWVMAPALFAVVAFAEPLIPRTLGDLLTPAGADQLVTMLRILSIAAIPTGFFLVSGNAILALQRWRRVSLVAAVGIGIHASIVLPLSSFGPNAITFGHAAAMVLISAVVVRATLDAEAWRVVGAALVRIVPPVIIGLVFVAARIAIGPSPPFGVAWAGMLLAGVAYLVIAVSVKSTRVRSNLFEWPSR